MTPTNSSSPSNQSTGHGNTIAKTQYLQLCPPFVDVLFVTLDNPLPRFVNGSLNVALAVATTFANLVILLAMRRVTSIRLPSKLLLCSLVVTDLGAGSVVMPQFGAILFRQAIFPDLVPPCALDLSLTFTAATFSGASFLTLAAISLDRYAALFFHFKYQQIVTTRRVCAVLAFIWVLPLLLALASLLNRELCRTTMATATALVLLVISVLCIKIYRRLRAQGTEPGVLGQAQQQAGNTALDMERYRRTASVIMLVYVLLLICYLPLLCVTALRSVAGRTPLTECLWEFTCSLVLLNSFLNPFVYCLRLPEFRTEAVKQLRKLFCRSNSAQ